MPKTFRLRILRRHINAALAARDRGDLPSYSCPVVQALKERGYKNPGVGGPSWSAENGSDCVHGTIHADGCKFINNYDAYAAGNPTTITVSIH